MEQHTSEKLAAVATGGFLLMLVLDMIFDIGIFEGDVTLMRLALLMILIGNLGVMVRHLKNKDDDQTIHHCLNKKQLAIVTV